MRWWSGGVESRGRRGEEEAGLPRSTARWRTRKLQLWRMILESTFWTSLLSLRAQHSEIELEICKCRPTLFFEEE